jgi:nitrate reductase gamma subunit
MTLLDFARGPALEWALVIFIAGILWRLLGVLLLTHPVDFSAPRTSFAKLQGARTVFSRAWPSAEFIVRTRYQTVMAYVFHIGMFVVVVGFVPHIEFITGLTGLSWPGLPNFVATLLGIAAVLALVAMLVRRLTDQRKCCVSTWDDYFSWFVTAAPLVTGLMAFYHLGPRYETLLAMHILSIDLLLVWFPFGKLMHAFWAVLSRAQTGAAYYRKGVRI